MSAPVGGSGGVGGPLEAPTPAASAGRCATSVFSRTTAPLPAPITTLSDASTPSYGNTDSRTTTNLDDKAPFMEKRGLPPHYPLDLAPPRSGTYKVCLAGTIGSAAVTLLRMGRWPHRLPPRHTRRRPPSPAAARCSGSRTSPGHVAHCDVVVEVSVESLWLPTPRLDRPLVTVDAWHRADPAR